MLTLKSARRARVHIAGTAIYRLVPRWVLSLRPDPMRDPVRVTRGGKMVVINSIFWASRPASNVNYGVNIYRRHWSLRLDWPLRLAWIVNHNPSRAWTGREWELLYVEHWTPRGWYRRFVGGLL